MKAKEGKKKAVDKSYKEPMRPKQPHSDHDKKMIDGKRSKKK